MSAPNPLRELREVHHGLVRRNGVVLEAGGRDLERDFAKRLVAELVTALDKLLRQRAQGGELAGRLGVLQGIDRLAELEDEDIDSKLEIGVVLARRAQGGFRTLERHTGVIGSAP